MDWNSSSVSEFWYVLCSGNETKVIVVYELTTFQRIAMDNCIWIKIPNDIKWTLYNSLYFSNGVIGVYDPSNVSYNDLLRIEFEDPLDALTIERGLCFSFLNQFELGIENEEVIAGIKYINDKRQRNELTKSTKANINYLAKVVDITDFLQHPNAERMKIAQVGGYKVCVGIDEPAGRYVYFPVNSEINPNLLSYCNLYRHTEKNANTEKAGFFNDNGRVTAIKLRGFPSEGFLLPYEHLENFIADTLNLKLSDVENNTDFDIATEKDKEFWICKKYIVVRNLTQGQPGSGKRQKRVALFNKVLDTQFRFHYDTVRIQNDKWAITPNDLISITEKIHGTSGISAYVLCKKKPTLINKIKSWFGDSGIEYDYLYASRSVVKNATETTNPGGYYGCDIWAEADKIIRPHLQKGMTIYYEIVGFLPTGAYIQKNYDYGCIPPESGEAFMHEKHFKVRVYRITMTNVEGYVHEFSAREVQTWCKNSGLIPVTEYFYGLAKDLYNLPVDDNWTDAFWDTMANDKKLYMECNSPSCSNNVPHEGLVIKKEDMISRAWKLKCFAFLNGEQKELDAGIENIEDNA